MRAAQTWRLRASGAQGLERRSPAVAFDEQRGTTVLFGGWYWAEKNETWEWDGATWTQLFPSRQPSARSGHSMVYDSRRGVIVLFGGYDGSYRGEAFEWDGTTWTRRAGAGPGPRSDAAMAFDSGRGVVVLFGGFLGGAAATRWRTTRVAAHWSLAAVMGLERS
ncbi:MAG: kelch repeat-containing protein [Planctomycetota bacterium]